MSNNKLLNTSVDIKQKFLANIFFYYQNIIFKNPLKVKKYESQKTEENWLKYEILYYKVQENELTISENLFKYPVLNNYVEENTYLIELRELLLTEGLTISAQEIRFVKDNTVLGLKNFDDINLDYTFRNNANEIFRKEADYMYSTVSPRYYSEIENFYYLFDLILKFRCVIKLFSDSIDESLNINTIDPYLLNNFFLSNGFTLGLEIPTHLKANFALSLFKIYETKGTYQSFFEILTALNANYPIFSIYLLRMKNIEGNEEFRAIKIPVVTKDSNPYDYLKRILNTYKGSELDNILRNLSITNEEISNLDPKWQTNLVELLDYSDGLQIIKTNYHYIELSRNLKEVKMLWSLADIISRYISEDIILSTNKIESVNLKQIIALLNSLSFKAMDISINIEEFSSKKALNRVASFFTLDEIKTEASKIRTTKDLSIFFGKARKLISKKMEYDYTKQYYDPSLYFLDIPEETAEKYKDLLQSVDMFNDLVAITTSSAALEFYDELIFSIDDLLYQLELPSVTTNIVPIDKILNYFSTFYSTLLTHRNEGQQFLEFNYGHRHEKVIGLIDMRGEELGFITYEDDYAYKNKSSDFILNFYFKDEVPLHLKDRMYKNLVVFSDDLHTKFSCKVEDREQNRQDIIGLFNSNHAEYEKQNEDYLKRIAGVLNFSSKESKYVPVNGDISYYRENGAYTDSPYGFVDNYFEDDADDRNTRFYVQDSNDNEQLGILDYFIKETNNASDIKYCSFDTLWDELNKKIIGMIKLGEEINKIEIKRFENNVTTIDNVNKTHRNNIKTILKLNIESPYSKVYTSQKLQYLDSTEYNEPELLSEFFAIDRTEFKTEFNYFGLDMPWDQINSHWMGDFSSGRDNNTSNELTLNRNTTYSSYFYNKYKFERLEIITDTVPFTDDSYFKRHRSFDFTDTLEQDSGVPNLTGQKLLTFY